MKENNQKYLFILFISSFSIILIGFSINRVIDPYNIFYSDSPIVNIPKSKFTNQERLGKAYMIKEIRPDFIFLGTSRCAYSLDPNNENIKNKRSFNACFGGASIYEVLRYLQHSFFLNQDLEVFLGIDYLMFNNNVNPLGAGFSEEYLSVDINNKEQEMKNRYSLLMSFNMLTDSLKTLFNFNGTDIIMTNGMKNQTYIEKLLSAREPEFYFNRVEKNYYQKYYNNFSYVSKYGNSMTIYEKLLEFSYENDIKIHLAILPTHARMMEVLRMKNLQDKFYLWKKDLLNLNAKIAAEFEKNPYPIWDFAQFSSYNTEKVVGNGDINFFWESSHFKKILGDRIIDTVMTGQQNEDFGSLLSKSILDKSISTQNQKREEWIRIAPEDFNQVKIKMK